MQTARKFWTRATKTQRVWALGICGVEEYWLSEHDWIDLDSDTKAKIEMYYEDFWWRDDADQT